MKKIYKAKIEKRSVGSAIEHIPPDLKGTIITNVYDSTTDGDYRLYVVECSQAEHKANLSLDGVSELSKDKAISLAKEYQPARKIININPTTMKQEEITIPECDISVYLG
jgi:hypothetical protein